MDVVQVKSRYQKSEGKLVKKGGLKRKKLPYRPGLRSNKCGGCGTILLLCRLMRKQMEMVATEQTQQRRMLKRIEEDTAEVRTMLTEEGRSNKFQFHGPINGSVQICEDGNNTVTIHPWQATQNGDGMHRPRPLEEKGHRIFSSIAEKSQHEGHSIATDNSKQNSEGCNKSHVLSNYENCNAENVIYGEQGGVKNQKSLADGVDDQSELQGPLGTVIHGAADGGQGNPKYQNFTVKHVGNTEAIDNIGSCDLDYDIDNEQLHLCFKKHSQGFHSDMCDIDDGGVISGLMLDSSWSEEGKPSQTRASQGIPLDQGRAISPAEENCANRRPKGAVEESPEEIVSDNTVNSQFSRSVDMLGKKINPPVLYGFQIGSVSELAFGPVSTASAEVSAGTTGTELGSAVCNYTRADVTDISRLFTSHVCASPLALDPVLTPAGFSDILGSGIHNSMSLMAHTSDDLPSAAGDSTFSYVRIKRKEITAKGKSSGVAEDQLMVYQDPGGKNKQSCNCDTSFFHGLSTVKPVGHAMRRSLSVTSLDCLHFGIGVRRARGSVFVSHMQDGYHLKRLSRSLSVNSLATWERSVSAPGDVEVIPERSLSSTEQCFPVSLSDDSQSVNSLQQWKRSKPSVLPYFGQADVDIKRLGKSLATNFPDSVKAFCARPGSGGSFPVHDLLVSDPTQAGQGTKMVGKSSSPHLSLPMQAVNNMRGSEDLFDASLSELRLAGNNTKEITSSVSAVVPESLQAGSRVK